MVVILTEEPSMQLFLETLISRYYPNLLFKVIPHRGKQDLEKHIPKILKSWHVPNSHFLIVHDQDSWDCRTLKNNLQSICNAIRPGVVVRIACVELEAWYWGDLLAVEQAFGRHDLQSLSGKSKYRIPDSIVNPKDELRKHLPHYEQLDGAKRIAEYAMIDRNTSNSFQVFIKSLQGIAHSLTSA
ncbi:MAG: DUF4276 family protein [Spirochaetaceae bacterium]|jgi:hypothetical protein|nr:DUF4276 family protein [Spirochaetaceae bacterium]